VAFSVGDLIARLRMDSKEFDVGVQKAQAGLKTVEAAAVKADRAVGMSQRALNAYTGAQRLSTAEIQNAVAAYDGKTRAAIYNTRAMVLQHMKALEMNAAFDAGAVATRRSAAGMSHLATNLRAVAVQMAGVNPLAGRLLGTIGQFALGTGVMVGVFAGIAGLSALFRYLTRDAREAKAALEGARDAAEEIRAKALPGSVATGMSVGELRTRRDQLGRDLIETRRLIAVQGELPELVKREADLQHELAEVLAEITLLRREAARQSENEADARAKLTEATADGTAEINRQIEALNRLLRVQQQAMNESLMPLLGPGRLGGGGLAGNDRAAFYRGPGGGMVAFGAGGMPLGIDRSDEARARFVTATKKMHDGMEVMSRQLPKATSRIDQLGEGAKRTFENFIDMGALGANLASQGISSVLGMLGDALFGPKYVNAIEENTRALKRMAGDTSELEEALNSWAGQNKEIREQLLDALARSQFGGALELARRRSEAMDLDAAGQFTNLQTVLSSVGGALGKQIANLTPEMAGQFLTDILDQIAAGTFNVGSLGRVSLEEFLDVLAEMESLGDAAGDAAGELGGLASTIRNSPAGFKANFLRYQADTGVNMQQGYEVLPPIHIQGDMIVVANDPDEFGNEVRRQARRGGATALQLATRPAGAFVKGGV